MFLLLNDSFLKKRTKLLQKMHICKENEFLFQKMIDFIYLMCFPSEKTRHTKFATCVKKHKWRIKIKIIVGISKFFLTQSVPIV